MNLVTKKSERDCAHHHLNNSTWCKDATNSEHCIQIAYTYPHKHAISWLYQITI